MPYLFVLNGRERFRVLHLTGDEHTIGQRDDADFVLKDPWISWSHARIVREGDGFAIEDLGSTNGTYVDCVRVVRQRLADDDVVFLGRTHLLFVASDRPPSPPPPRATAAPPGAARDPLVERFAGTDRLPASASHIDVSPMPADEADVSAAQARRGDPAGDGGTFEFRGPLEGYGRIEELDDVGREPDTDGFLPPPPPPELEAGVEIDVADLIDSQGQLVAPPEPPPEGEDEEPSGGPSAPEPIFRPLDPTLDPIAARDAEIARLRVALAAREGEVRRLRDEVQRLKEQYLDL